MSRAAWIALIVVSVGCEHAPPVGATRAPIVDGILDGEHPAVVAISTTLDSSSLCTGTLVAPNVVLTAKHCTGEAENPALPENIEVREGQSFYFPDREHEVTEVHRAEGCWTPCYGGADIALLVLGDSIADVDPLGISWDDPRALEGEMMTVVGYGLIPTGGAGHRYATEKPVTDFRDEGIILERAACQGDSGGPIIGADGLVHGVGSYGLTSDASCGEDDVAYNPLDRYRTFIENVLADPLCVAEEEVCDGEDNDCDDVADEGCAVECADSSECDDGFECMDNECVEVSEPPVTAAGEIGDHCDRGRDCTSGLCAIGDGQAFCTATCGSEDACPDALDCRDSHTIHGKVCAPPSTGGSGGCSLRPEPNRGLFLCGFLLFAVALRHTRRS